MSYAKSRYERKERFQSNRFSKNNDHPSSKKSRESALSGLIFSLASSHGFSIERFDPFTVKENMQIIDISFYLVGKESPIVARVVLDSNNSPSVDVGLFVQSTPKKTNLKKGALSSADILLYDPLSPCLEKEDFSFLTSQNIPHAIALEARGFFDD